MPILAGALPAATGGVVPLPTLLLFAFASGVAGALAAQVELRVNPRSAVLTRGFVAYLLFAGLVLVPISVYFYVFHGDWFLLYFVDVRQIPSAVALLGFALEAAVGAAGFVVGAALVRSQRQGTAGVVVGLTGVAAAGVIWWARERLAVVGSFAQYRGDFGLAPYGSGSLVQGSLAMGGLLLLGLAALLFRLHLGGRR